MITNPTLHAPCCAVELQACATAASEKIAHLEEAAEAAQTAHEQELKAAQDELATAKVCPAFELPSTTGVCPQPLLRGQHCLHNLRGSVLLLPTSFRLSLLPQAEASQAISQLEEQLKAAAECSAAAVAQLEEQVKSQAAAAAEELRTTREAAAQKEQAAAKAHDEVKSQVGATFHSFSMDGMPLGNRECAEGAKYTRYMACPVPCSWTLPMPSWLRLQAPSRPRRS